MERSCGARYPTGEILATCCASDKPHARNNGSAVVTKSFAGKKTDCDPADGKIVGTFGRSDHGAITSSVFLNEEIDLYVCEPRRNNQLELALNLL